MRRVRKELGRFDRVRVLSGLGSRGSKVSCGRELNLCVLGRFDGLDVMTGNTLDPIADEWVCHVDGHLETSVHLNDGQKSSLGCIWSVALDTELVQFSFGLFDAPSGLKPKRWDPELHRRACCCAIARSVRPRTGLKVLRSRIFDGYGIIGSGHALVSDHRRLGVGRRTGLDGGII